MADRDYFSFDEVLNDLKLEEDELKRLVSAGEIRAFRDKNTMRFKAEDVARLREQRVAPQDVELDELELELEDEVDVVSPGSAESEVESIDLGDVSGAEELVLEEASPTGEVIDIGAGGLEEAEVVAAPKARPQRVTSGGARRASKAAPSAAVPDTVESISEGGAVLVLMMAGALLLIVANFLVLDAAVGRASSALTRAVANMFS